jgi:hypothetical protein
MSTFPTGGVEGIEGPMIWAKGLHYNLLFAHAGWQASVMRGGGCGVGAGKAHRWGSGFRQLNLQALPIPGLVLE